MAADQNVEIVRGIYDAVGKEDINALLALYDDDVVQTIPGSSQVSGAHRGKESILGLYGRLLEMSGGTYRIELDHVMSDGRDRAIAVHTTTMEKNGETFTQTMALMFTMKGGKVVEIQDFFADVALSDRMFS